MNWNRREFSIGMGAAATVSLKPGNDLLALWPSRRHDMVIHEPAVGASAIFAAQCARQGAQVFSTVEDIGALWHGVLRQRIVDGASLGGLTRHATSFLIATLARDAGFRVTDAAARPPAMLTAWQVRRI